MKLKKSFSFFYILLALFICSVAFSKSFEKQFGKGWYLLSLPFEPTEKDIKLLFKQTYPNIFSFENGKYLTESAIPNHTVGKGYWVYVMNDLTLSFEGISLFGSGEKNVKLSKGWNIIGNPFEEVVEWNDNIKVGVTPLSQSSLAQTKLFKYENKIYKPSTSLFPWEGYWLKSPSEIEVTIPEPIPSEKGNIKGKISLKDEREPELNDFSKVNVVLESTAYSTSTDIFGNYQINNIKVGNYKLVATKSTYKMEKIENVKVISNTTIELPEITLYPDNGTIRGVVKYSDKVQQSGMHSGINIEAESTNGVKKTSTSDENGNYIISNIPEATYTIKFSSLGYQQLIKENIEVIGGKFKDISELVLNKSSLVAPTITSAEPIEGKYTQIDLSWEKNPEPNITYNVYVDGKKINDCPVTSSNYKVGGLNSGSTYSFNVEAVNTLSNESAISEKKVGKTAELTGEISVVSGRARDACVAPKLARKLGRTLSKEEIPKKNVVLTETTGEHKSYEQQADEFGNFEVIVPPGKYELKIDEDNIVSTNDKLNGTAEIKNIEVTSGETAGLEDIIITGLSDVTIVENEDKVYITDYFYGALFIIDGNNYSVKTYFTEDLPLALAPDNYNNKVYVTTLIPTYYYNISIMDAYTDNFVDYISIPASEPENNLPFGIDFNEYNESLYVANLGTNQIVNIDLPSREIIREVDLCINSYMCGIAPTKVLVNPLFEKAYVSFYPNFFLGFDFLILNESDFFSPFRTYYTTIGGPYEINHISLGKRYDELYFMGISYWLDDYYFCRVYVDEQMLYREDFISTFQTGIVPNAFRINNITDKLYISFFSFLSDLPDGLIVVDGATLQVERWIDTSTEFSSEPPSSIIINELKNKIYVINDYDAYTLSVIDGDSGTLIKTIDLFSYLY